MPRPRKGARLYLRKRGQSRVWVILDGGSQIATGAGESELGKAEAALSRHIAGKPRDVGPRDPSAVTIAEVIAVYAEQRGAKVLSRLSLATAIERLLAFFATDACASITPARCDEYTEWRCGQTDRRKHESEVMPHAERVMDNGQAASGHATMPRQSELSATGGAIKPSTARRELAVLSAALTWAWRNRIITEHIPVRLPPRGQPRQRHLTRLNAFPALKDGDFFSKRAAFRPGT